MPEDEKDIVSQFRSSWKYPEEFYSYPSKRWDLHLMPPVVSRLQELGYNNIFRAGMCLGTLILSRSRNHGLRPDQPYIAIVPNMKGGLKVQYLSGGYPFSENQLIEEIDTDTMEITPPVEVLLKRLAEYPID